MTKKEKFFYRNLAIAGVIYFVFLAIIILGVYFSLTMQEQSKLNYDNASRSLDETKSNLTFLKAQIARINNSLEIWKNLNKSNRKRNGLEIDSFKQILADCSNHYHLKNKVNVNLTSPSIASDAHKKKNTVIETSTITLIINAQNDNIVFAFIDSLIKNTPGFFQFSNFNIEKKNDISEEFIADASKRILHDLVEAKVVLLWRDFRDI